MKHRSLKIDYARVVGLLSFLACMSPRYIATFKIRIGINFSYFDLLMISFWLLVVRKSYRRQYNYIFVLLWLAQTVLMVWRAEQINIWGYFVLYISVMYMFMQSIDGSGKGNYNVHVINGFILALAVHLVIGVLEIVFKRYFFEIGNISRRYLYTTGVSIFHNPNDYSMFIVVLFPFAIFRLMNKQERGIIKLVYSLMCLGCIYFAIANRSRTGVISLFVFFIFYFIQLIRNSKHRARSTIIALIVSAFVLLIPDVTNWLVSTLKNNSLDVVNQDLVRINLIRNGIHFLEETYGFGVGAGNLYNWFSTKSIYYIEGIRYMHNWYAEILTTFGVIMFILYIIFHIKILLSLRKSLYHSEGAFSFEKAAFLSFVAFTITSISSSTNVYSEWTWVYLGWMSIVAYTHGSEVPRNFIKKYFSRHFILRS